MFLALSFELNDINPDYSDILFQFLRCPVRLTDQQLQGILEQTGLFVKECEALVRRLLWFGFLGVQAAPGEEPQFSYQVRYNIPKLLAPISAGGRELCRSPGVPERSTVPRRRGPEPETKGVRNAQRASR